MARRLVLADAAMLAAHPGRDAGDVVGVFPDEHVFSEFERRVFIAIDTPGESVDDALRHVEPGCPQELQAAQRAATEAMLVEAQKKPRDERAFDAAKQALADANAAVQGFPWRAVKIDPAALPREHLDGVATTRAALDACAAEAKTSAKALVIATIEATFGQVDQATLDTKTIDIIQGVTARADAAEADGRVITAQALELIKQSIIDASKEGRDLVVDPVLARLPLPDPVVMDARAIDAATVTK